MHCPTLIDLPAPPTGKTGWPWIEETPQLPATMPDGSPWPRISIVTPSYNQGQFIEETIRSVLLQGYPNLEYIIVDGGSTDNSVEIIKKYEPWLSYWVSEKDRGQSHAINKGMQKSTGDIFAWINSDDVYKPVTLIKVARIFSENRELDLVYGRAEIIDENSVVFGRLMGDEFDLGIMMTIGNQVPQPSAFFTAKIFREVGEVIENYHFSMDYDLWLKIGSFNHVQFVDDIWSQFRLYDSSKSGNENIKFDLENYEIIKKLLTKSSNPCCDKTQILGINSLKVAQAYRKNGNKFQGYQWALKAFVNNPSLAWKASSLRVIFYSMILGPKLKNQLSRILMRFT